MQTHSAVARSAESGIKMKNSVSVLFPSSSVKSTSYFILLLRVGVGEKGANELRGASSSLRIFRRKMSSTSAKVRRKGHDKKTLDCETTIYALIIRSNLWK